MGRRTWPPLTWQEMADCFEALGWWLDRSTDHTVYVDGKGHIAPLDKKWQPASGPTIKHVVVEQARLTRDEFYGATKATAKKVGLRSRQV
jgi:hypothetical protein